MAGSGQGIRAGKAFVELFTNDTELLKGLKRAQRKMAAFGAAVTRSGAMLAGVAAGMGALFIPAIRSASDLQEIMGKFDVVFGDASKDVKEWSDNFAAEVGRSKKQIAEFLSGSQDLFVPLGFEPGAAQALSKQLTGLAVDLASFNNMADADAMRDLQAALTGSGEVMKKYGVIVSEAAVKQELLNMGIDPALADNQAKVQARLNIIMAGTTAAQGDALRTSGSFANQMKRLSATFEDTKDVVGSALLPLLTEYVEKLNKIIPLIAEWISNNRETVVTIAKLIATAVAAGLAIAAIGKAIGVASLALGTFNKLMAMSVLQAKLLGATGAVVAILAISRAFYNANASIRAFNEEMRKANKLDDELAARDAKRLESTIKTADSFNNEADRTKFLQEEIATREKEIAGQQASIKGQQKLVEELNTTWNRTTGNKILEAEQAALEQMETRLQSSKAAAEQLRSELERPGTNITETDTGVNIQTQSNADAMLQDLQRQLSLAKGETTEFELKLKELQEGGLPDEEIEKLRQYHAELQAVNEEQERMEGLQSVAAAIGDALQDPDEAAAEQLQARADALQQMLDKGLLTEDQYAKASEAIQATQDAPEQSTVKAVSEGGTFSSAAGMFSKFIGEKVDKVTPDGELLASKLDKIFGAIDEGGMVF